jgi:hypothetical protein
VAPAATAVRSIRKADTKLTRGKKGRAVLAFLLAETVRMVEESEDTARAV